MARLSRLAVGIAFLFAAYCFPEVAFAAGGQLKLIVVDKETQKPIPVRMHLRNVAKRLPKVLKVPTWDDHIVFDGEITLKLPKGYYGFELECGPEYLDQQGHFQINDFADDEKSIEMKRFITMSKEGWYSGDFDVERPIRDLELLMRAEDLHVAHIFAPKKSATAKSETLPTQPYLFDGNRYFASPVAEPVWRDVQQITAWDFPVKVALGEVDSVELASPSLYRNGGAADEKNCKPRDKTLFPGPEGLSRWGEKIYFHLLDCGLRIPPSAGSGSGRSPNPVGYNRIYAHIQGPFSYEAWLDAVRTGRTIVTNGPLIRPTVENEYPGHVFHPNASREVALEVGVNLATREDIAYLDIVKNGSVAHSARLAEFQKAGGRLPKVVMEKSGWFLLRVVTSNQKTRRFAMTAPYYVEIGDETRVSRSSAQFFLDWVNERMAELGDKLPEKDRWEKARGYWQELLKKANTE